MDFVGGWDVWGDPDISRSTTVGREIVDRAGTNEFLLGREVSEWFGNRTSISDDPTAIGCALSSKGILVGHCEVQIKITLARYFICSYVRVSKRCGLINHVLLADE